jgi:hypothetical protein
MPSTLDALPGVTESGPFVTRDNPDLAGAAFAWAYIERMQRGVLVLGASVIVVVGLVARGGSESADCVSAVQFDGESYIDIDVVSGYRGPTNDSDPQLGELALVTAKEVCGETLNNGESTTLPPGTELFFVVGEPDLLGHFTADGVRLYVAGGEYGTAILSP